jgi:hypothetical protein
MGTQSYNIIYYNGKSIRFGQRLSDGHLNHAGVEFLKEIKNLIEEYGLEEFIRLLKEVEFKEFEFDEKGNNDGDEDYDPYAVHFGLSYDSLKNIIKSKVGYTNTDCSGMYKYFLDLDTLTVGLRFHEEDIVSLNDIDKLIESWKN